MKNFLVLMSTLVLMGCSMLPPSASEFKKTLDKTIGKNIYEGGGDFYKIEKKGELRMFYYKGYNYSTKGDCRRIYIVDNNDTIVNYKILTPNFCKIGYSAVW